MSEVLDIANSVTLQQPQTCETKLVQSLQGAQTRTVAYLECAKGGGPGGLGDGSPPVGSRGKAPVGGLGDEVP